MGINSAKKFSDLIVINSTGFSMWPFLRPGEKLIIKKVPLKDLRVGDIILYKMNGEMISHRLVKKVWHENRYIFFTKGDASFTLSEPIIEEAFLGKVVGLVRNDVRIIDLTGRWHDVFNKLIVKFAPLVVFGIKIIRGILRRFTVNSKTLLTIGGNKQT